MRSRVVPAMIVFAIATLSLSGCSTLMNGALGLKRSGNNIEAVVQMCDGNTVTKVEINARGVQSEQSGEWKFDKPVTTGALKLGTVDEIANLVDSKHSYYSGASGDVGIFANGPDPTRKSVSELQDGEVLSYSFDTNESVMMTFTDQTFKAMVDRYCASLK